MKRNWDLNIGNFEWDPSDGVVRFPYCFFNENGLGFEVMKVLVNTLLETGDKHWPELKKMADGLPEGKRIIFPSRRRPPPHLRDPPMGPPPK